MRVNPYTPVADIVGIRFDLGGVEVDFRAPDEACVATLIDNRLEEAPKDSHAIAVTHPGEA